jgi:hemin uptake protein HemP
MVARENRAVEGGQTPRAADRQLVCPDPVVIDTEALFGRCNEIRVRHRGQEYRLRITKAGKLILTK